MSEEVAMRNQIEQKRSKLRNLFRIKNDCIRVFLAELFGTFVFVSFGLAGVAQFVFGSNIPFISVNISFAFGLTMGIIVAGKISGGHFNPAVSLAFLLLGKLSLVRFFVYAVAQNLGAFLSAAMVYLVYLNEFTKFEPGMHSIQSSGVFGTLPKDLESDSATQTISLFFDQFFATALFVTCILAICDDKNTPSKIPHTIKAVLVGLSLLIVGSAFGINCGFAVNPARDFAPRFFTFIAGWGTQVFTAGSYFFWIPIVAPMVGAAFAVIFYQLLIANHWPDQDLDL